MERAIIKLKYSLEEKIPSMLLGAGFSVGACNSEGNKLPLASELAENLYKYMFVENPPDDKIFEEDSPGAKRFVENTDLKGLCSLISEEKRKDLRDQFLTDVFKGAQLPAESMHKYITEYKWERIFTLNIDDLVENIYESQKQKLNVWNNDKDDRRNNDNQTVLIKLHGCVRNPMEGYVFDEDEYTEFLNEETCFLKDFGEAYVHGDMIFIGTEFQESDLRAIINKYENAGYDTSGNNYFFVMPNIHDARLRRKINETENYFWIQWNTDQFFEFLHSEVSVDRQLRKSLRQKGMLLIEDAQKEAQLNYESLLYIGRESQYDDFFNNWDMIHPGLDTFEEKVMKSRGHVVAALIGKSYVGKTCAAKRLLMNLNSRGFITCEFYMRSSEYMFLFLEYLKKLPDGVKVAVLFENASFYYSMIYRILIKQCPKNVSKLVIITSETTNNHNAKKDILQANRCIEIFNVTENISWGRAEIIYQKLKEKQWLNRPEIHGSDKYSIKEYAVQTNDIIEFLYNITNGRGFEDHYIDMVYKTNSEILLQYLQALALLEVLGISSIPTRIFPNLLRKYKNKFSFNRFKNSFDEILLISNHRIKLRCLRLVQKVLIPTIGKETIKEILKDVIIQTAGQFQEGDLNEWYEIFQKAISVKELLKENILGVSDIRDLLNSLEKYGQPYNYYWIQRGIASQKDHLYDLADNYFRKALQIRPVSYQAHHALAKNLMERAIYSIEKGEESYAPYYLAEGQKEIRKIMCNPAFSRGYKYSLHTYIDMLLKYLQLTKKEIKVEDAGFIQESVLSMKAEDMDTYFLKALEKFVSYCYEHNMEEYAILQHYYSNLEVHNEAAEEDYLIESLDLDY